MKCRILVFLALATAIPATMTACSAKTDNPVTPAETQAIAREAYVYGFPMVMNIKTINSYVLDEQSPDYKGPFNEVSCAARLYTPEDKAVVTPNSDTPYCMFWIDLRAEPVVLSVPEMEANRFYHFQLIDFYTHNFDYVGTLTTGNGAGRFLVAGPGWEGPTPGGITKAIRCETNFAFSVVRTQLMGPDDLKRVEEIQNSYGLEPLSAYLGTEAPPSPALPDFPPWVEGVQFDERFFGYLDFAMSLLKNPGPGETPLWDKLARLGIGPQGTFDFDALSPDIQEALKAGQKQGLADIEKFIKDNSADPQISAKIFGTRDFLTESAKKNYDLDDPSLLRATGAHMGLYGNSGSEAIYPVFKADADGQPLDGSKSGYTLTFAEGQFPPVNSFWSVTMYDGKTQLFIHNPLDRYLLNSTMTDQFKLEDDGSLVLYISKDSPGDDLESNWLPAPDGPFYVVMRLYGPKAEALDGTWTPPAVKKS